MAARETAGAPETLDDLLGRLGGISPKRVRMNPLPGTATVKDVVRIRDRERRLFELVDGTLVEKIMGAPESYVAVQIASLLHQWNSEKGNVGMVLGEAGTLKLLQKLVRIPDVSFTGWDQLPDRKVPREPVPDVVPDLAVEVLSRGNTKAEMRRKLKEYFLSGVRLVWFIDPRTRTARTFISPDQVRELGPADTLDGGDVLPGFQVPLSRLFAHLPEEPAALRPGKKAPKKKRR